MLFFILVRLRWTLAFVLLVAASGLWERSSCVARNGPRITRQGQLGLFWTDVVG